MLKLLHNKIEWQICFNDRDRTALFLLLTIIDLSIISAATPSSTVLRNTLANDDNDDNNK
jgi:hypothetical protein